MELASEAWLIWNFTDGDFSRGPGPGSLDTDKLPEDRLEVYTDAMNAAWKSKAVAAGAGTIVLLFCPIASLIACFVMPW